MGGTQVRLRQRGHEDEKERGNVLALAIAVHPRVVREEYLHGVEGQEIVPLSRRQLLLERCRRQAQVSSGSSRAWQKTRRERGRAHVRGAPATSAVRISSLYSGRCDSLLLTFFKSLVKRVRFSLPAASAIALLARNEGGEPTLLSGPPSQRWLNGAKAFSMFRDLKVNLGRFALLRDALFCFFGTNQKGSPHSPRFLNIRGLQQGESASGLDLLQLPIPGTAHPAPSSSNITNARAHASLLSDDSSSYFGDEEPH